MSELKTLQDLSAEEWKDRKELVELWVKVDELKQEAIKWIRAIDSLDSKGRAVYIKFCEDNFPKEHYDLLLNEESLNTLITGLLSMKYMLEHFCNITKEDLND